ncbi:MAG: biotin--[acetyl-CoA-carboxylase] ligase [Alphaproteobacteria bacterium]|nr:biotin--[acetyl-CoA-carboxylase] ligase [Alphaproteobacteria bacterium]
MDPRVPAGYSVAIFDEIDSTNEEARRRAAVGERGPLWIFARRQTAGRGRRGREWDSPDGNLMATLLIAPGVSPPDAARLSFVAALAVHDLVSRYASRAVVRVKWPNDVLVDGRKIAGILLESASAEGQDTVPWLAVGIGVNLIQAPTNTAFPATFVGAHGPVPSPAEALAELAAAWETRFRDWRVSGFAAIREAWLGVAAGVGHPIEVRLPGETLHGRFETLMPDGALSLLLPSGIRRAITAGEVFFAAKD